MAIDLRLDVPALERLIGGDTEVEVKLRQGVIEAFAKRHITAVLKDKTFRDFLAKEAKIAQDAVDALILNHYGTTGGTWNRICILSPEFKKKIEEEVERQVSECVRKTVEKVWAEKFLPTVERSIERVVSANVTHLTGEAVRKQVNERIAQVLKGLA